MNVDPIQHQMHLTVSAAEAFETYVHRIGDWWPAAYSVGGDLLETVVIEAGVGGRVYERHVNGQEYDWGRVTVWRPGREVAYTSVMAQNRDCPSEVGVRFTDDGTGSLVEFEHGGWVEGNLGDRVKFSEWPVILASLAATAEAPATTPAPTPAPAPAPEG